MNAIEFNDAIKAAAEQFRSDTGVFANHITVLWNEGKIEDVSTSGGTVTHYKSKEEG